MSESTVPQCRIGNEEGSGWTGGRSLHRVESSEAIASENLGPGTQILHRETNRVKFNGDMIISSELTHGQKVFDNVRSY
jgi:hypothetical protein